MSEEANIDVVRGALRAWNERDRESWVTAFHVDGEWVPAMRAEVDGASVFRGHDQLRRFWDDDASIWQLTLHVDDIEARGDLVVATGRVTVSGAASGAWADRDLAWAFELRDGLIARLSVVPDVAAARAMLQRG